MPKSEAITERSKLKEPMPQSSQNNRLEKVLLAFVVTGVVVLVGTFVMGMGRQKASTKMPVSQAQATPILPKTTATVSPPAPSLPTKAMGSANGVSQHLQMAADSQIQATAPGKAQYRFGVLTPEHLAQHTFQMRNTFSTPMVIEQLIPSCPCVHGSLHPATTALPKTLAPGESVAVDVTLEPVDRGHVTKYIWVCVQGQAAPAASLAMTGTIQDAPVPSQKKKEPTP